MSRYIKYYTFNVGPNEVFNMANQFLITHGFVYKNYHGENVFQKGQGWAVGPKFVKLTFNANVLQLEAWVKYAVVPGVYAGEMDLTGIAGIATKKPLQTIMDNLESQLMQLGCRPVAPPKPVYSAPVQPQPQYTPQSHAQPQSVPQPMQAQPSVQTQYAPPVQQAPQYTAPANNASYQKNGGQCLRCGGKVTPGAAFCRHCGLKR